MGNQLNTVLHGLHVGEVSQSALARTDFEKLRLAAEIQENILPHVIGKGQFRPGTSYIGETDSNNKARLLPFIKANDDTALLEMTDSLLRVRISDTLLTRGSVTSTILNSSFATASATVTITIASPGVVTWTAHGRSADDPISFTTTGALPTGLTANTLYYVKTVLTVDTFTVSATAGGAVINTSGSQSGTHTGYYGWTASTTRGGVVTMSGGTLTLQAPVRGSAAHIEQAVTTSSGGSEHALRIVVSRGPVLFRCGSTSGGDEYIAETEIGTGEHSLAFTPSGTYYVRFISRTDRAVKIDSVSVEGSGTVTIAAPWVEADLPSIRSSQSGDIVFLACSSWQQRKIERRGTGRSWSLVKYETDDGPFVYASTNKIRVSSSASYGDVTLTASEALFSSDHVGSLIRLFPQGFGATFALAGEDTYTDAVRIRAAGSDMKFVVTTTGTWAGTGYMQFSFDGEDTGFVDAEPGAGTPWQFTANLAGVTFTPSTNYNNVTFWARVGFKTGTYTSGTMNVTFAYTGSGTYGVYRITEYSSATSVTARVLRAAGTTASTDSWQWGAWSETKQWPSAVGFYDGRLFWGGLDKFWGSKSDSYSEYTLEDDGDDGSIQRDVATGGTVNQIKWFLPLQRLVIGTTGSEVSVRSSSFDEPLTPTGITLKDASTHGVANVSPAKLDNRGLYVHRDGTHLHEIVLDAESNDYRSSSLMLLNDTIGGTGITEIAIQRSPETYVWAVRADGQLLCLLYDVKEKAAAWVRCILGASAAGSAVVESVCVLPSSGPDRVYIVVRRTINGGTKRYIEKLALHTEAVGGAVNRMLDSHVYAAGPVSSVTAAHLLNETGLKAWATNGSGARVALTGLSANGAGSVSLGGTYTDIVCGLGYSGRYKSAKLAYGAQKGTAVLQPKRVAAIGLLTENTHPDAIEYGPDFSSQYQLPRVENGQDVVTTTVRSTYDEATFPFEGGWDTDSRVCLTFTAPYPATVNAIVIEMETNES